jgi:CheY-like chemotaxis protein
MQGSHLLLTAEAPGPNQHTVDNKRDQQNGITFARRLAGLQGIQFDCRMAAGSFEVALTLSTARTRTVLYVDDSPDMGRLFRQYLQGTDYGLVHVRSAERAVQMARQAAPDVIVLDVLLPTADGWQLLEQLRTEPAMAATPVIVCSVLPEATLAASLGVAAFLAKPVTRTALLSALTKSCPPAPEAHRGRPASNALLPPS